MLPSSFGREVTLGKRELIYCSCLRGHSRPAGKFLQPVQSSDDLRLPKESVEETRGPIVRFELRRGGDEKRCVLVTSPSLEPV